MSDPRLTEERLRTFLDGNQPSRERLCLAVLALDQRYTNVRPRRPKGGPDGARDIQAVWQEKLVAWGAVGFRNSACDSNDDKRWVQKKFKDDLASALDENPALGGFVFMTNVDLTPGEESKLLSHAISHGLQHAEIFNRERLRIALDAPSGFAYRLQHLGLSMSETEQAAFFARFGDDLERLIQDRFSALDEKLERLEFLHGMGRPFYGLDLEIRFRAPVTPEKLDHFRVLVELIDLRHGEPHPTLWIAATDEYLQHVTEGDAAIVRLPGTRTFCWSREPDESIQDTVRGDVSGTSIETLRAAASLYRKGPFPRLADLDGVSINLFVTTPVVELLDHVLLVANEYAILERSAMDLVPRDARPLAPWPVSLTADQEAISWTQLVGRGDDPSEPPPAWPTRNLVIDFANETPRRVGGSAHTSAGLDGASLIVTNF